MLITLRKRPPSGPVTYAAKKSMGSYVGLFGDVALAKKLPRTSSATQIDGDIP